LRRGSLPAKEESKISLRPAADRPLAGFAAALLLFAVFLWLGAYVTVHHEPPLLLQFDRAARGHAIGLAWIFTEAGRAYVLAPLYCLLILVAIVNRRWRVPAIFAVCIGLAGWGAADFFQHVFARPRRADWILRHETAFSYPSSHAAIATGFYFLSGVLVLKSNVASWFRYSAFCVLTLFAIGIAWSRLALAAHYVTDVIGGVLLALAVACTGAALLAGAGAPLGERAKSLVRPGPMQ